MTCTGCGAPMRLDEERACLVCDYCSATVLPEPNNDGVRIVGDAAGGTCPACAVPLLRALVAGQRVQSCPQCEGVLIPMDLFLPVVEALRLAGGPVIDHAGPTDWKALDRHIRCPQCGDPMDTHPYGGPGNVVIDVCEQCSLNWLDAGELSRIVRSPDRVYG